jgi:tripartite-type tricarboxylate transporter receptor subunit TctC
MAALDGKYKVFKGGFVLLPRFVAWMCALGMMLSGAGIVTGQNYPNRPLRMVTAEAGGGVDFTARVIAQGGLSDRLGQQLIVDNRGGAGGAIAAEIVAKAPPDGHTLLVYASAMWFLPLLRSNLPYDPVRDFAPITCAAKSPNMLVVHPTLPVSSVKDLIALARARPGELNYGSGGTGSTAHLAAELFKAMAGVDIVRIPYKGTGPALNDLIAGRVRVMFATAGAVTPHVRSGRLKALAVTSAQPSVLAPDLPTVAASGLPGYELISVYGIFAPVKTPAAIVKQLNQEIVRILGRADVKERFLNNGMETVGSSPEELAAMRTSDMARMGKVIKDAGIREDQ